jgi:hypothetical protein
MPRPKPFWTLDCETDPFKHGRVPQPFMWGAYNGNDYEEFQTAQEVVNFFRDTKTVVYAHNGGKFDYHYLREDINTDESISIISGRFAKFRIGICEFRDSMNILPVPLAAFKKDDIDYAIFEPDARLDPNNMHRIRAYLRSDCVYLHELISEHRKENGVVLTQAGASMRAWLKQSKRSRPRQSALNFERYKCYYYGGRVQCFEQGVKQTDFKVVDINSAYPFAMLSRHPISPVGIQMSHLPTEGEIERCMVSLHCTARGCFPWRDERDGSLYFPEDEHTVREYHVTGYELVKAFEHNAIKNISIDHVHYFTETVDFKDFILENWERRAQAKRDKNAALSLITKLLMNSLYGKFSSDYAKYFDYVIATDDSYGEWKEKGYVKDKDFAADRFLMRRSIEFQLNQEEDNGKSRYYNIATAASITGYVRAELFDAAQKCGGLIYCDTDSIAARDVSGLRQGDELGLWKEEGEFDHYAIAGKKTYAFHKRGQPHSHDLDEEKNYKYFKVASKGVDLDPADIARAASGQTVKYKPEVPTYSIKRTEPIFINRVVRNTAKDIRHVSKN